MDGRDAKPLSASPSSSYHHIRGFSGYAPASGAQTTGFHPPAFRSITNPSVPQQSNARETCLGPAFPAEPAQANAGFHHGMAITVAPSCEAVKRKRGRPRKYGPDGAMSLGLSPMAIVPSPGSMTPTTKRSRGRPRGSGRKQRLAALGPWMVESAGIAFAPHIITVEVGEDIAAKVLLFSQQRPRVLCVLAGNGMVSTVTLRQPTSSGGNVTYEGRFEILCLSGAYLLSDSGGPRNRIGGVNVSLSSMGGPVIGGSVGELIAASPVQVVACSFVYGSSRPKNRIAAAPKVEENSENHQQQQQTLLLEPASPSSAPPTQNHHASAAMAASALGFWPGTRELDLKSLHTDIDLRRG